MRRAHVAITVSFFNNQTNLTVYSTTYCKKWANLTGKSTC